MCFKHFRKMIIFVDALFFIKTCNFIYTLKPVIDTIILLHINVTCISELIWLIIVLNIFLMVKSNCSDFTTMWTQNCILFGNYAGNKDVVYYSCLRFYRNKRSTLPLNETKNYGNVTSQITSGGSGFPTS